MATEETKFTRWHLSHGHEWHTHIATIDMLTWLFSTLRSSSGSKQALWHIWAHFTHNESRCFHPCKWAKGVYGLLSTKSSNLNSHRIKHEKWCSLFEQVWQRFGRASSVLLQPWPTAKYRRLPPFCATPTSCRPSVHFARGQNVNKTGHIVFGKHLLEIASCWRYYLQKVNKLKFSTYKKYLYIITERLNAAFSHDK